jgi:hypothetical protein
MQAQGIAMSICIPGKVIFDSPKWKKGFALAVFNLSQGMAMNQVFCDGETSIDKSSFITSPHQDLSSFKLDNICLCL